jgi:hypothetical protein
MMIDVNQIKKSLTGLVGFRQGLDSNGLQILPVTVGGGTYDLSASESGVWYDGVHPLLTLDNLYSIAPDFEELHRGETGLQALINQSFSNWLVNSVQDSIGEMLDDWKGNKEKMETYNDLLESVILYLGGGLLSDVEVNGGNMVGLQMNPKKSKSVRYKFRRFGFHFEQDETFTLYLFRSDKKSPIASESIAYTGDGSVQWQEVSGFASPDTWKMQGDAVYYLAYSYVGS